MIMLHNTGMCERSSQKLWALRGHRGVGGSKWLQTGQYLSITILLLKCCHSAHFVCLFRIASQLGAGLSGWAWLLEFSVKFLHTMFSIYLLQTNLSEIWMDTLNSWKKSIFFYFFINIFVPPGGILVIGIIACIVFKKCKTRAIPVSTMAHWSPRKAHNMGTNLWSLLIALLIVPPFCTTEIFYQAMTQLESKALS